MKSKNKTRDRILTLSAIVLLIFLLAFSRTIFGAYVERILILCAIYAIAALSMSIVNGFTGMFSLGLPGFMAIGAYVFTILSLPVSTKATVFYVQPIVPWLANVQLPMLLALVLGGVLAALAAFLIGFPVLRLRGDYLAIATLGFSEIIRIMISTMQSVTNGASGISQIPNFVNKWVAFAILAVITIFLLAMMRTSYGRAFKSLREDEVAAQSMGINLFKHKLIIFMVSGFIAGIAGGMLASFVTAVDPNQFRFVMAYNILLMVVLGGQGSISGAIVGAFTVTITQEYMRVLDDPIDFGFFKYPGISGMRMVVYSILLMVILLFWNRGLFGDEEFSWNRLIRGSQKMVRKVTRRVD